MRLYFHNCNCISTNAYCIFTWQIVFPQLQIVFLPGRCRHDEPRLLARRVRAPSKRLILLNIVVCRILRYFEETTLPVKTLLEKSKAKQYPSNWYLAHQPQSQHWGSQKKIKENIEQGVLFDCGLFQSGCSGHFCDLLSSYDCPI